MSYISDIHLTFILQPYYAKKFIYKRLKFKIHKKCNLENFAIWWYFCKCAIYTYFIISLQIESKAFRNLTWYLAVVYQRYLNLQILQSMLPFSSIRSWHINIYNVFFYRGQSKIDNTTSRWLQKVWEYSFLTIYGKKRTHFANDMLVLYCNNKDVSFRRPAALSQYGNEIYLMRKKNPNCSFLQNVLDYDLYIRCWCKKRVYSYFMIMIFYYVVSFILQLDQFAYCSYI